MFQEQAIRILIIIAGAWLLKRGGKIFLEKLIRRLIVTDRSLGPEAEKQREDTLIQVAASTLNVLIWLVAALVVLEEAGFAVGPFIAAAGVAGLALGFGGQYLIRDVISGLFIILENQYRVGDVVCLGDVCGAVESVNLRLTILRDLDGAVHHIPNGEIKRASNLSKGYSRINLNMGVAYSSNLEHVITVVNQVGNELATDTKWRDDIIKPPQFLRVDDFADSAMVIKILGETKPRRQWDVTGELRKRLKLAFDREGIEIPFPQRVVHAID